MVLIRSAVPDDVATVTDLIAQAFSHYTERIGTEPAPMHTDYGSLIDTGTVWVAEDTGRTVGTIVLTPEADHLQLDNLAVSPAAQGLGIGAQLLDFAAARARALGLRRLDLYTNELMTENLDYYPRHGFTETHRAAEDGFSRVFFTKEL